MFPQGPLQPLDHCRDAILDRLASTRALVGQVLASEHGITDPIIADDICAALLEAHPSLLILLPGGAVAADTAVASFKREQPWQFAPEISPSQAARAKMKMDRVPAANTSTFFMWLGSFEVAGTHGCRRVHVAFQKWCADNGVNYTDLGRWHLNNHDPEFFQKEQNAMNRDRVPEPAPATGPVGDIVDRERTAHESVEIRDFSKRRNRTPAA